MRVRRGLAVFGFALIAAFALPVSLAAADNPAGCVVCHKGDKALPTLLATIKGHPNVSKIVKSVPDGCAICHKPGAKAPALHGLIHSIHKVNAPANAGAADVKGSCLMCHSVEGGQVAIKKAKANW